MKNQKNQQKKLEKELDGAFKVHGHGVQFNIMDLSRMKNLARDLVMSGKSPDEAMKEAVQKYRVN